MKKIVLGNTGIEVTELCFGALPLGPLQKDIPLEDGIDLIAEALECGVTFVDTAQAYRTYPHIRGAIEKTGIRPVIATKSFANSYEDMDLAVKEALEALGLPYIDIFLLHAARAGTDVFEQKVGALACLHDYKKKGIIRAVGISSHDVRVIRLAAETADMDIVFPILNRVGRGILNGTLEEMEEAINLCFENKKGVYFMKALGGGSLIKDFTDSINYVRNFSAERGSLALGMVSKEELDMNIRFFSEGASAIPDGKIFETKSFKAVQSLCQGCAECVKACHSGAISIGENGKAEIDTAKCITCGYCVAACPYFSIRMV